jgi:hypothetical protein
MFLHSFLERDDVTPHEQIVWNVCVELMKVLDAEYDRAQEERKVLIVDTSKRPRCDSSPVWLMPGKRARKNGTESDDAANGHMHDQVVSGKYTHNRSNYDRGCCSAVG